VTRYPVTVMAEPADFRGDAGRKIALAEAPAIEAIGMATRASADPRRGSSGLHRIDRLSLSAAPHTKEQADEISGWWKPRVALDQR